MMLILSNSNHTYTQDNDAINMIISFGGFFGSQMMGTQYLLVPQSKVSVSVMLIQYTKVVMVKIVMAVTNCI